MMQTNNMMQKYVIYILLNLISGSAMFSQSQVPLKSLVFCNTDTLPLATTLNIYSKDDERFIMQV